MVGAFLWFCPLCECALDYVPERYTRDLQKALLHNYSKQIRTHWRRCIESPEWGPWW